MVPALSAENGINLKSSLKQASVSVNSNPAKKVQFKAIYIKQFCITEEEKRMKWKQKQKVTKSRQEQRKGRTPMDKATLRERGKVRTEHYQTILGRKVVKQQFQSWVF